MLSLLFYKDEKEEKKHINKLVIDFQTIFPAHVELTGRFSQG